MKLETEVTAVKGKDSTAKKKYVIESVETFTGVANTADAVMITKQAFIMAGRSLVMKKWLEKHPIPDGKTLTEHQKTAKPSEITLDMWPTAEEVLEEARKKAVKKKKSKVVALSPEEILRQSAALLGIPLESLLSQAAKNVAAAKEEEEEEEDEEEEVEEEEEEPLH